MKKVEHWELCQSPICAGDPNPNYKKEVTWYPSEEICGKSPRQRWQKMQGRINKKVSKGTFKYPNLYFTAEMLEKLSCVMNGTKGIDPDRDIDSQMAVFDKKHQAHRRLGNTSNLSKGNISSLKKWREKQAENL